MLFFLRGTAFHLCVGCTLNSKRGDTIYLYGTADV